MSVQIQFRRGISTQWVIDDPLLAEGEIGLELDTNAFKIGNGVNYWNELPYATGIQGTQGLQGRQGIQGTQGLQGRQGIQGTQGLQGNQGTQGLQGRQGVQGTLSNNQGTQGNQGVQGLSNQGVQGTQGLQGNQGTQGLQGRQGIQGLQGNQGTQGTQGSQGTQGLQGRQGIQGLQGAQGTQGVQGFSPVGIPSSSNTTLVSTDAGKFTIIDANVTIDTSTNFVIGDMCTIYNSGTTTRTITATGVTLRWAGTSSTGNRQLSQKGLGNILCVATNDYVISGAGIT